MLGFIVTDRRRSLTDRQPMKTLIAIEIPDDGLTFNELLNEVSKLEGKPVHPNTLKDWITKACLLSKQDTYSIEHLTWLARWIVWKNRRRRPLLKDWHEYMKTFMEDSTNATHPRTN